MLKELLNLFKSKKLEDDHKLVLSLDGGGVRGLATVIFLKELEKISGKKIFDLFDFFIGTSAGGLSAMHLVINKTSANDLENFWSQDNLAMSMRGTFWTKNFFLTTKPKYNNESRTELLERYFGNKLISDSEKPIAVLSYDVEDRKPRVLSSYNDKNIRVISAINATSAAPLYYPTVQVEDGSWLIDGGVVANNPCLVGYNEARKYFETEKIKVFSVGTGIHVKNLSGEDSSTWGPFGWLANDILGILLESHADHEILNDLIGKDYLRINSAAENINWNLDDYSEKNLENIKKMGLNWWKNNSENVFTFLNLNKNN